MLVSQCRTYGISGRVLQHLRRSIGDAGKSAEAEGIGLGAAHRIIAPEFNLGLYKAFSLNYREIDVGARFVRVESNPGKVTEGRRLGIEEGPGILAAFGDKRNILMAELPSYPAGQGCLEINAHVKSLACIRGAAGIFEIKFKNFSLIELGRIDAASFINGDMTTE